MSYTKSKKASRQVVEDRLTFYTRTYVVFYTIQSFCPKCCLSTFDTIPSLCFCQASCGASTKLLFSIQYNLFPLHLYNHSFHFHLYILLFHKLIVFFTIVAFTKLCYYLYTHYYLPIFTCLYIIIKQLNGSVKKESRQNGHQYTLSATILLYRCYELIIMEG